MSDAPKYDLFDVSAMTDLLARASCEIGIDLGERELGLFQEYGRELVFWNQRTNLVSLQSAEDLPVKHFADSLTAARYIADKNGSLIDIGTGAGLPGIPLKILFSDLKVTLLESSRRKVSFLKNIVRKLDLGDVRVVQGRAEQLMMAPEFRHSFDTVISRAVFKLREYLLVGEGFLSPEGVLIAMKGPGVGQELAAVDRILGDAGLKVSCYSRSHLPVTGNVRKILIYQKA